MNIITWGWYEFLGVRPFPDEPFFLDLKFIDIDETIIAGLKNRPEFLIGMSIDFCVGKKSRNKTKEYADAEGLLIEFKRTWIPNWNTMYT